MRHVQFVGKIKYLTFILIVMQAVLILMMVTFHLGDDYDNQWESIESTSDHDTFYVKYKTTEQKDEILDIFHRHPHLMFMTSTINNDTGHKVIGVVGDAKQFPVIQSFNHVIVSSQDIVKLFSSREKNATIGPFNGSVHSIKKIDSPQFSKRYSILKMQDYMDITKSVEGSYTVYGLHRDQEKEQLLQELSAVTHQSTTSLMSPSQGMIELGSMLPQTLSGLLLLNMVALFTLFVAIALSSLKNLGFLTLLGWSKLTLAKKLFQQFVIFSILLIPILGVISWWVSGWYAISLRALSYFFLGGVIHTILIFLMISFAGGVVFSMKPINAIKGKMSMPLLYLIGGIGYVLLSGLLVIGSLYMDSPMKQVVSNIQISKQWQSVIDVYTLKTVNVGDDQASIAGKSNILNKDVYQWYQSIVEDPDVYIAHSEYISRRLLDDYRRNKVYQNLPETPFWYMTFSPNYLKKIGIKVHHQSLTSAEQGTKVFLIPDTYSDSEREKFKKWIKESEKSVAKDSDMMTAFNENNRFEFVSYHYDKEIFNWSVKPDSHVMVSNPIVYIITPANMNDMQSGSLRSNEMNGYIKFDNQQTAEKYTTQGYLSQYHLDDNALDFVPIRVYIDGLQKDLVETITWFGLAILTGLLLSILVLLSIAYVYRLSNNERCYISKFLGYGFLKMYNKPLMIMTIIWIIDLGIVYLRHSKSGIIIMIIYEVIQLFVFYFYMTRNDIKQLLLAIKERT
ncbi:amino acid ABC transporter permease [Staphylococcus lutrae]|uniref:Amino acid ABC transporter permease n=1 Tax=Staphylococcus lutrae TaxID=155085 RepID=A0AAC9RUJ9_9STAP|nr:amino acid ABC transporter permease [Staphylococcus lutrae]ARJ51115.1 amino acid ABC transporter permease [Staphylococcus lutrae]PNZ34826.1 amino acid ABC transporter permease [Staphylococcus lutrae]